MLGLDQPNSRPAGHELGFAVRQCCWVEFSCGAVIRCCQIMLSCCLDHVSGPNIITYKNNKNTKINYTEL